MQTFVSISNLLDTYKKTGRVKLTVIDLMQNALELIKHAAFKYALSSIFLNAVV